MCRYSVDNSPTATVDQLGANNPYVYLVEIRLNDLLYKLLPWLKVESKSCLLRCQILAQKNIFFGLGIFLAFFLLACPFLLIGVDPTGQVGVAVDVADKIVDLVDELGRRITNRAVILHRRRDKRRNWRDVDHILPCANLVLEIHEAEVGEEDTRMAEDDVVDGEDPRVFIRRIVDNHIGCIDLSDGTEIYRVGIGHRRHVEVQGICSVETVTGRTCTVSRGSSSVVNESHDCGRGASSVPLTRFQFYQPNLSRSSRSYPCVNHFSSCDG